MFQRVLDKWSLLPCVELGYIQRSFLKAQQMLRINTPMRKNENLWLLNRKWLILGYESSEAKGDGWGEAGEGGQNSQVRRYRPRRGGRGGYGGGGGYRGSYSGGRGGPPVGGDGDQVIEGADGAIPQRGRGGSRRFFRRNYRGGRGAGRRPRSQDGMGGGGAETSGGEEAGPRGPPRMRFRRRVNRQPRHNRTSQSDQNEGKV